MFAGRLNFLEIPDIRNLAQILHFFFQHFAVSDNCVERRAQFVAHIREERALGAASLLRSLLCSEQFFLSALAMDNLHFQLMRACLKFIVGALQRRVTQLDFG